MADERFYVALGPLTIADIIEGLEASLPDPKFLDEVISTPASLKGALPGHVTFLASKKSVDELAQCKATACFVSDTLASHVGEQHIIPIISKYPRAHFARAMNRMTEIKTLKNTTGEAKIAATASVHKSAVIGANAQIGDGSIIGPNSVIGPGVNIGANCVIEENVSIKATTIGEGCTIKAGAVIGGTGFGVDRDELGVIDIPHFGCVSIGANVLIGANSCVDRGQLGDTKIGDNVKIDNLVQIGHNVEIGDGSRIAGLSGISGSCRIGRDVMIGGAVGLADHLVIADKVSIAARSGVMHNIPEGEVWGGTPAQPMRDWMRTVAMTRKLGRKPKKISNGA